MNVIVKRRILVIDDNRAIHDDFRKVLGGDEVGATALDALESLLFGAKRTVAGPLGLQIDFAYQGDDGLARVQQAVTQMRPYALAFVDMRMPPGWDGIETVQRMWEVDPDVFVVICTAHGDHSWEELRAALRRTERFLVLKKPFDNVELRQLTACLMEQQQMGGLLRVRRRELQDR